MGAALVSAAAYFGLPVLQPVVYDPHAPQSEKDGGIIAVSSSSAPRVEAASTTIKVPKYVPTPAAVKGAYMTQCVVGTPSFRERLVSLVEETELNSLIIDIKDYSGGLGYDTDDPKLAPYVSTKCGASDIASIIAELHEKGIYVIGRITVFQDPLYAAKHPELAVKFASPAGAVWKDRKGLSFIDVGAKPYWDYIVHLSRDARLKGFDELNYDYVRYPSDGPMQNIHFDWAGDKPKAVALEEFFAYLNEKVKDPALYPPGITPPKTSADLFGMTTTNTDDLNIGQVLERALPYFDYVAPMVYPSHYPPGFNGWNNPNSVPYELMKFVLGAAVRRTVASESSIPTLQSKPIMETVTVPATGASATTTKEVPTGRYTKEVYDKNKIRTWIQDFSLGQPPYGAAEVSAQIQATYDVGLNSWMLWDPGNTYTRGALGPAE